MPRLNPNELEQLTKRVQDSIASTPYACSSLQPLNGGTTSFVFRGALNQPFVDNGALDKGTVETVIVKHATNFASCNREFAIDDSRSGAETVMLRALRTFVGPLALLRIEVITPRALHFDESMCVQVLEDLSPVVDLATLISSSAFQDADHYTNMGVTIGSWLRRFHEWTSKPIQSGLFKEIAENCRPSRDLKRRITYDCFIEILQKFPAILDKHQVTLKQVEKSAHREFEKEGGVEKDDEVAWGIIHGDFWTGNILKSTSDLLYNKLGADTHLYVIDWEFAQYGHRAYDLGQMIGDLLEKNHFMPSRSLIALVKGFVKGYGAVNDEMAFRVAVHVGVHMLNWCSRHAPPHGDMLLRVEELMKEALGFVVKGWERDRIWFERGVLDCLFS